MNVGELEERHGGLQFSYAFKCRRSRSIWSLNYIIHGDFENVISFDDEGYKIFFRALGIGRYSGHVTDPSNREIIGTTMQAAQKQHRSLYLSSLVKNR